MTDSRSLLIVDDDTAFRERLVRAMRDRGFEATGVPDHPAAIDAAREESPEKHQRSQPRGCRKEPSPYAPSP